MNQIEGKKLHKQLRLELAAAINTSIDLLASMDEEPTLITILGTMTTETHEILIMARDKKAAKKGE